MSFTCYNVSEGQCLFRKRSLIPEIKQMLYTSFIDSLATGMQRCCNAMGQLTGATKFMHCYEISPWEIDFSINSERR